MSEEKDRAFFRNFSIVVFVLAVMMVAFLAIAQQVGNANPISMDEAAVTARTQPVGAVRVAGVDETSAVSGAMPEPVQATPDEAGASDERLAEADATGQTAAAPDGEQVYNGICVSCHATGIPGIPQLGDIEAWAPRIAQGMDVLYQRVIEGYTGQSGIMMPPRGGNPQLSDDEIHAAVDYMVEKIQ